MSQFDFLIRNGFVVTAQGINKADVSIAGEKISEVSREITADADEVIDASGKYVLPGIIDPHTHPVYLDDLKGLSRTAAHGGITTVIHYAYAKPGNELLEVIDNYKEDGEARSYLDFGLHGGLFDAENQAEDVPKAVEMGVNSFKMFMTYAKLGWMTDDYQLMRTMDIIAEAGGMGMVHAENGLATDYLQDKYNDKGLDPVETFLSTRPARLEAEAINRAISMAKVAGCPIYIPHLSAKAGVEVVEQAKRDGYPVFGETCPQYLTLTSDRVLSDGPLAKIGPPLREQKDQDGLWEGLRSGTIETIASDHAPKPKKSGDDFFDAPFGSPQVETMLALAYDGGVNRGKLTLPQLVERMSTNAAKIFGLYPEKGSLKEGSDADLVIFDPEMVHTIENETQHSNAYYTLYEGKECLGKPVSTFQRGKRLLDEGELHVEPGNGKFLETEIDH
ncbi:dihydropyrimidinase [Candidatus Bipolaricaulota bacterium]|nr:dihydropyrimidinase [Candidatus Bipolaricaulota bacterium]